MLLFSFCVGGAWGSCSLRRDKHWVASNKVWVTKHNALVYGDQVFHLKGLNWNGFESDCRIIHGLWANTLDHYLDILHKQDINALRFPLPFESMENMSLPILASCVTADPSVPADTTVGHFIMVLLNKLRHRGMFALFDLHTIGGEITEFPWSNDVTEERVVQAWTNFAQQFGQHPAIMGLEIKNEPHGACTTAQFHQHSANVISQIRSHFPGLFFIDGTALSWNDEDPKPPWGGTFEGISSRCDDDALCQLGMSDKLVFSPHVYGPDVRGDTVVHEDAHTLERRYGFLRNHPFFNDSAIVVTEFGGRMEDPDGPDYQYFEMWKQYMHDANMTAGSFFWTFPPSSYDTGGFLEDDWQTIHPQKLQFLKSIQPAPTILACF